MQNLKAVEIFAFLIVSFLKNRSLKRSQTRHDRMRHLMCHAFFKGNKKAEKILYIS